MHAPPHQQTAPAEAGLWRRLRAGVKKTRDGLTAGLDELIRGPRAIDAALLDEIEARLLMADMGAETTADIVAALTAALGRRELSDRGALIDALRTHMLAALKAVESPLFVLAGERRPFLILVIGVNGSGKTTTIGKLAHYYRGAGQSVLLAAGDTFRAAAIEQILAWGTRVGAPVIAQKAGGDAAAVVYDALGAARARDIDLVIADTAGRLHTRSNLMEELKKIRRTASKFDADMPVETLLVLDAGTGQNAINQAQRFHEAVGLTGLIVTKLDGTARGGVLFALARRFGIPIRFIGLGDGIDDLRPFAAAPFVDALLAP